MNKEETITALLEHLEALQLEYAITDDKTKKQNIDLEIYNVKREIKSYE